MSRLDLRSREYKVMLLPERFAGDDADVRRAAAAVWADVDDMVDGLDIQTSGGFDTVKAHRRIRFFDTQERHFHAHQYVLPARISVELGERQVTLEFRHPDRYGDDDEDYRGTVTRDAHDIPLAMAEQLPLWVHPTPITKTAFVYG